MNCADPDGWQELLRHFCTAILRLHKKNRLALLGQEICTQLG